MTESIIRVEYYLDIYTDFYLQILRGAKKHEIRKEREEKPFEVGKSIQFREIRRSDMGYTGDSAFFRITHINRMDIAGVYKFAIMSIERIPT